MAKQIDWEKNEEENKSVYKDYAPEGKHKTKVEKVALQEASTGSKGIRFILADNDEYAFPKYGATAWISQKESWRIHHMKELFIVLGFTEAQARKAVEQAEDAEDLAKSYLAMFEKAIPKSKEVEVAVYKRYEDDEYATWDFADENVRMGRPEKDKNKASDTIDLDEGVELEEADKDEVDLSDVPFN